MHGKPSEVSATALDALLAVELEAVAVEEGSCGKTGKIATTTFMTVTTTGITVSGMAMPANGGTTCGTTTRP